MFFPEEPVPVEVVRELASLLRANNLGELAIESGEEEGALRLQIQRETIAFVPAVSAPIALPVVAEDLNSEVVAGEAQPPFSEETREIGAPCVGVYRAPKKQLKVGDRVRTGQVIAIVESMRVPNEVLAPIDATILEIPVTEGQGIEWGQTLVVLDPIA